MKRNVYNSGGKKIRKELSAAKLSNEIRLEMVFNRITTRKASPQFRFTLVQSICFCLNPFTLFSVFISFYFRIFFISYRKLYLLCIFIMFGINKTKTKTTNTHLHIKHISRKHNALTHINKIATRAKRAKIKLLPTQIESN